MKSLPQSQALIVVFSPSKKISDYLATILSSPDFKLHLFDNSSTSDSPEFEAAIKALNAAHRYSGIYLAVLDSHFASIRSIASYQKSLSLLLAQLKYRRCLYLASNHTPLSPALIRSYLSFPKTHILYLHHLLDSHLSPEVSLLNRALDHYLKHNSLPNFYPDSYPLSPLTLPDVLLHSLNYLLGYSPTAKELLLTGNQTITWKAFKKYFSNYRLSAPNAQDLNTHEPSQAIRLDSSFQLQLKSSLDYPSPSPPPSLPRPQPSRSPISLSSIFSNTASFLYKLRYLIFFIFITCVFFLGLLHLPQLLSVSVIQDRLPPHRLAQASSLSLKLTSPFLTLVSRINPSLGLKLSTQLKSQSDFLSSTYLLYLTQEKLGQSFAHLVGATQLSQLSLHLDSLAHNLVKLQHLSSTGYSDGVGEWSSLSQLSTLKNLVDAYRQLSSRSEGVNLLIVLVDSTELRPGGGFITALGTTSLAQGVLGPITWHTPSTLDSKTGGSAIPPDDLAVALATDTWYLRDANWFASMEENDERISWFLEKQINFQPDITLTLTAESLRMLLSDSEVRVGEYSINSTNYYDLLHSNSIDRANLPKPPEALIFENLLARAVDGGEASVTSSSLATLMALTQAKQLTLTSTLPHISEHLALAGVTSRLPQQSCQNSSSFSVCQPDFFGYLEANISINHANRYITRKRTHHLDFDVTSITHQHDLKLVNSSPSPAFPYGDYRFYSRFLLPKNSTNIEIFLNGQPLTPSDWFFETYPTHKSIALISSLKTGASSDISVKYSIPLVELPHHTYAFHLFKQPGLSSDPLEFDLNAHNPLSLPTVLLNGVSKATPRFETDFDQDQLLMVAIQSKP